MKLLKKVMATFDRANDFLTYLAGALVLFVMLLICTEIFMRYFLKRPLIGTMEITEYCLLYICFLVTAWLLKREGHVKMDLVLNRLNSQTQAILNIITSILGAIICLIIVWNGAKVTWEYFQLGYAVTTELKPPKAPIMVIIPVGGFLLFIQFLRRASGYLGDYRALQDKKQGS